ncbi:MAG: hypothetical protein J07HQX50_00221 [Haloquadratum sp. J07HQX50]|nr:MAG: hypothetical protein J07HQX50_00221 [Haloquadratum sp. J07HQX50]
MAKREFMCVDNSPTIYQSVRTPAHDHVTPLSDGRLVSASPAD